jgi:hypothetical protein
LCTWSEEGKIQAPGGTSEALMGVKELSWRQGPGERQEGNRFEPQSPQELPDQLEETQKNFSGRKRDSTDEEKPKEECLRKKQCPQCQTLL